MVDRERAAQMRRDGKTYREIGEEFGVSKQRAEQILHGRRIRKRSTDMEKIPYEGLYNWLVCHPEITFPALAQLMFGGSTKSQHAAMWRLLHGRSCKISKKAYDRLIAATGMTYEQLFKLREGFKEEED